MPVRAPEGAISLTADERDLLLDLGQMGLDIAGIVDPTPISDGSNMLISLGRGDTTGAAISAVSMIPLLGDAAKGLKLPRYLSTLSKVASQAAQSATFRQRVFPVLKKIATGLEAIGTTLPSVQRRQIDTVISQLEKALGGRRLASLRVSETLERMALQLLSLGWKHRDSSRPIALYFGIGFPPPIPTRYWTVERLIGSALGGTEFLDYLSKSSYRDVEHLWSLLSERIAVAAATQNRVDVFVNPQWFQRMFPNAAVSAIEAEAAFVAGAKHVKSGRLLDEAFLKVESLELRDVQFIAVTPSGKEVARQKHRL